MADRGFIPPVRRVDGGWALNFDEDERDLLARLMTELHELLTADDASELLGPLFPTVYTADAEKEAEYQRLMREELVASRLAALETVRAAVGPGGPAVIGQDQALAFMQAVNAVRLVLGTMLQIGEDEDLDESDTPEHHLYTFLSWVLEWTVRSLSNDRDGRAVDR